MCKEDNVIGQMQRLGLLHLSCKTWLPKLSMYALHHDTSTPVLQCCC